VCRRRTSQLRNLRHANGLLRTAETEMRLGANAGKNATPSHTFEPLEQHNRTAYEMQRGRASRFSLAAVIK
jgi:hypothetical protein